MQQKVYAVFHDYRDCNTELYHYQSNFKDFIGFYGTKEEANKTIGLLVLENYYDCCDYVDRKIEEYEQLGEPIPSDVDFLQFSIVEDTEDTVVVKNDDALQTYYYEKYIITTPS